jgi:LPS-assembly lipoprotein
MTPLPRRPVRHHIRRLIEIVLCRRRKFLLHPNAPQFAPNERVPWRHFSRKSAEKTSPFGQNQGGRGVTANLHPIFGLLAALGCAVSLSACGFHPLYGSTTLDPHLGPTLSNVYVEPISDRVGYELRNNLLDLFDATGAADGAAYRLKLSISEMEEAVVLQANTAITRYNYTLSAHYELIPRESAAAVKSGDVTALSAYNVAAAPFLYATVTAERDAKNRAANDIAERIRTQIAVYLRNAAQAH